MIMRMTSRVITTVTMTKIMRIHPTTGDRVSNMEAGLPGVADEVSGAPQVVIWVTAGVPREDGTAIRNGVARVATDHKVTMMKEEWAIWETGVGNKDRVDTEEVNMEEAVCASQVATEEVLKIGTMDQDQEAGVLCPAQAFQIQADHFQEMKEEII